MDDSERALSTGADSSSMRLWSLCCSRMRPEPAFLQTSTKGLSYGASSRGHSSLINVAVRSQHRLKWRQEPARIRRIARKSTRKNDQMTDQEARGRSAGWGRQSQGERRETIIAANTT